MVQIDIKYDGDLRCTATHAESGTVLNTDAPRDNQGLGESFSPTDLLATALGGCMLTVMGIAARRLEVDLRGATATVQKEMIAVPTRKISSLTVKFRGPAHISAGNRQRLEQAAMTCPVHKSLHPDVKVVVDFQWQD